MKMNKLRLAGVIASLVVIVGSLIVAAQTDFPDRPISSPGEAGNLFWLIANAVLVFVLIFAIWALYGKMRHEPRTNLGYHALGALAVGLTLFSLFLYFIPATQSASVEPTERAWDWTKDEAPILDPSGSGREGHVYRGYEIFLANGCTYCHTLYLRPQDVDPQTGWGIGSRPDDISEIGDFVNYPYTMLGTQRNGPDLTIIGRLIPNMDYHVKHLVDPRLFKPLSVMPSYGYLSDQDLNDLAAFMVSLGNMPDELREGSLGQQESPDSGADPAIALGKQLANQFSCLACHSIDGSRLAGPTWLDLYGSARDVDLASGGSDSVVANDAYLEESMRDPGAKVVKGFVNMMSSIDALAGREVSDEEIAAIVAYIRSLSSTEGE